MNLFNRWYQEEVAKQKKLLADAEKGYECLRDRTTPYAQGIGELVEFRKAMVKAAKDYLQESQLAPTPPPGSQEDGR